MAQNTKRALAIGTTLLTVAACAPGDLPTSRHFTLHRLADGVFAAIHVHGGTAICNAGIVDLGDETLVFDPFMTPEAARDLKRIAEEETGNPVTIVVNSHYHNDHIRGTQVFGDGVRVLATSWTAETIPASEALEIAWERANAPARLEEAEAAAAVAFDSAAAREARMWVGYYRGMLDSHDELRTIVPTEHVDSTTVLRGTERAVHLIPFVESHTGSDLVMYVPDADVVFMGDLLFVDMHPYLPDGFPDGWVRVLEEIDGIGAERFVPGHGEVSGPESLATMADYVRSLQALTAAARREQRPVDELLAEGVPSPFDAWMFPRFYEPNIRFLYEMEPMDSSGGPEG